MLALRARRHAVTSQSRRVARDLRPTTGPARSPVTITAAYSQKRFIVDSKKIDLRLLGLLRSPQFAATRFVQWRPFSTSSRPAHNSVEVINAINDEGRKDYVDEESERQLLRPPRSFCVNAPVTPTEADSFYYVNQDQAILRVFQHRLQRGENRIILGAPGTGKTSFCLRAVQLMEKPHRDGGNFLSIWVNFLDEGLDFTSPEKFWPSLCANMRKRNPSVNVWDIASKKDFIDWMNKEKFGGRKTLMWIDDIDPLFQYGVPEVAQEFASALKNLTKDAGHYDMRRLRAVVAIGVYNPLKLVTVPESPFAISDIERTVPWEKETLIEYMEQWDAESRRPILTKVKNDIVVRSAGQPIFVNFLLSLVAKYDLVTFSQWVAFCRLRLSAELAQFPLMKRIFQSATSIKYPSYQNLPLEEVIDTLRERYVPSPTTLVCPYQHPLLPHSMLLAEDGVINSTSQALFVISSPLIRRELLHLLTGLEKNRPHPDGPIPTHPDGTIDSTMLILKTLGFMDRQRISGATVEVTKVSRVRNYFGQRCPHEYAYLNEFIRIVNAWLKESQFADELELVAEFEPEQELRCDVAIISKATSFQIDKKDAEDALEKETQLQAKKKFKKVMAEVPEVQPGQEKIQVLISFIATARSEDLQKYYRRLAPYARLSRAAEVWALHFTMSPQNAPEYKYLWPSPDLDIKTMHIYHNDAAQQFTVWTDPAKPAYGIQTSNLPPNKVIRAAPPPLPGTPGGPPLPSQQTATIASAFGPPPPGVILAPGVRPASAASTASAVAAQQAIGTTPASPTNGSPAPEPTGAPAAQSSAVEQPQQKSNGPPQAVANIKEEEIDYSAGGRPAH